MKNPYEHDWLDDEIRVGRTGLRLAVAGALLFMLMPALSLLLPSLRPDPAVAQPSGWKERLAAWEAEAKTLPLFESWRSADQARFTHLLGVGNRKVFVGRDGWLYYRPDLEAVHGKGPYHEEPPSVARERSDRSWQPPVPVIEAFAAELAKRDIRLVFVPVPTKPMLCREGLGRPAGTSVPSSWSRLTGDLAAAGVEVVDLVHVIAARGPDAERYLKQDTHWTPGTMEAAAREVASRMGPPTGSGPAPYRVEPVERESLGDLVRMLDLEEGGEERFPIERATLRVVFDTVTGAPVVSDPNSDVVLLGDSFVNLFEDPALGFGGEFEEPSGCGFASHLALALGRPAQVIAINGGGATAVREAFARLPAERLAQVKTVIWVLSARDVLLPEIPARRAGIEWRPVALREAEASSGATPAPAARELVATLREKSAIDDPNQTPYAAAIFSTLFEDGDGGEHAVFLWAFRDRKLEPAAVLEPGRRYRLRLVPLGEDAAASRAIRLDDFFRPDLDPWFATSFERVE